MKNFKKVILFNIVLIVIIIVGIEIYNTNLEAKYHIEMDLHHKSKTEDVSKIKLKNPIFEKPVYFPQMYDWWKNMFRDPVGLIYKKNPVLIFGCSYAYGDHLNPNQTFGYKLSHFSKRPVYNRAMSGWSIDNMLWQLRRENIYTEIPKPEYIIYVFIDAHIERLHEISLAYPRNNWILLNYKKNKEGGLDEYVPFYTPIFRLNTIKRFYDKYLFDMGRKNPKYFEKNFEFARLHFIESKREIDKKWPGTKFVILLYNDTNSDFLKSKKWKTLEKDDFIVTGTDDLVGEIWYREDLKNQEDAFKHPSEEAWNLIVPALANKLKL